MPLNVEYYGPIPGRGKGNIMWSKPFHEMRGGKFPKSHPCAENPKPMVFSHADQPESDDPLGQLRALGYLASCFPEGDGICFDLPEGTTSEQAVAVIERIFGWTVKVRRL